MTSSVKVSVDQEHAEAVRPRPVPAGRTACSPPRSRHRDISLIRVRLLGPPSARIGDRELAVGSPLQQVVLACLALAPRRAAGLGELIDAIWPTLPGDNGPGGPPRTAAGQVHKYICQLRRELDPCRAGSCCQPALVRAGSGYLLTLDRSQVDATLFADLVTQARRHRRAGQDAAAAECFRAARELWHGDPIGGVPGLRAQAWRDRLAQEWLSATEEHIDVRLALGFHACLISELTQLTADYPRHEPFWRQQMLALYRASRQNDALAAYRTIERILDQDGLQPGPALCLRDRILLRDPDLIPGPPAR